MKYICSATVKHLADQPRDWLSFIASYSNTNVVVKMLMFLFSVVMVFGGLVVFLADKLEHPCLAQ